MCMCCKVITIFLLIFFLGPHDKVKLFKPLKHEPQCLCVGHGTQEKNLIPRFVVAYNPEMENNGNVLFCCISGCPLWIIAWKK